MLVSCPTPIARLLAAPHLAALGDSIADAVALRARPSTCNCPDATYPAVDDALQALDTALAAWLREQHGE